MVNNVNYILRGLYIPKGNHKIVFEFVPGVIKTGSRLSLSSTLLFLALFLGNLGRIISKKFTAFDFFGPTCDSMDYMKGPFLLPNNIKENDYIELGQLGAYGLTFRTQFNGYYSNEIYEVEDKPIMSMYEKDVNSAHMVA